MSDQSSCIADALEQCLLSQPPDLEHARSVLLRDYDISDAEADHMLFRIIHNLNRTWFPPVTSLELVMTEECNLACRYCFERDKSTARMDLPTAKRAIDLLFTYSDGCKRVDITFFGGEPLLNFNCLRQSAEYALHLADRHKKRVGFALTSNCTLLTEDIASTLRCLRIPILISIDGLRESHDLNRRDKAGRGTYDRVRKAIDVLKATGHTPLGARMTITPETLPYCIDNILGLHSFGITKFVVGPATGPTWLPRDKSSYSTQLRKLKEWQEKADPAIEFIGSDTKAPECLFGCGSARGTICVTPTGEIWPCSKIWAVRATASTALLGTLNFGITAFDSRLQFVTAQRLRANCERLNIAQDYPGGCFANNFERSSDLFDPSIDDYELMKLWRTPLRPNGSAAA